MRLLHQPPSCVAIGVDVGAEKLHLVSLDAQSRIVAMDTVPSGSLLGFDAYLAHLGKNGVVAIDGPAGPSVGAYAFDAHVSNKFRLARGCEVELGRQRKIWVSFATGPDPLSGWMAVAESVHQRTENAGFRALETYPYAIFTTLLGSRPPKKTSAAGAQERVRLLHASGIRGPNLATRSHDELDAAAAALVALHAYHGTAEAITSPLDHTSIWLPPAGSPPP